MMYIDQAPLGGNLVNIIKKSASLSNAAATPTRTESSAAKELNCENEATEKKVTTVNGDHSIPNGTHHNLAEAFNNILQLLQTTNNKLNVADKEEREETELEEDKTGYVLLDIEPDLEESPEDPKEQIPKANVNSVQNLTNGFNSCNETPILNKIISTDTPATSKKRTREVYEAEEDCEEFIVQIKPVPKLNVKQPNTSTKSRRPLPAAIPISDFIAKSEKCVLNKYLSRPVSRSYESDEPEETEYHFVKSGSVDEDIEPVANRMGMDILSGIWNNLFHRKSKTESLEHDAIAVGSKRKRSFGFGQIKTAPQQIKYRRVENNFPKVITRPFNDDLDNFPAYQQRPVNKPKEHIYAFPNNIEMTQKGEKNSVPRRRSLFELPLKKIVRNTTYADYEFSDDDDDDSQTRRLKQTIGTLGSKNSYGVGLQQQHQAKVRNIPIQIEQTRPPNCMSTNFMDSIRQPTYADILKQSTPYGNGHMLGRVAGSSNNSSGDGASSSRFGNILGKNSSRISSKAIGGSILKQQRAKVDHENYKQLLETLTSRVSQQQNLLYTSSRPQSCNRTTTSGSKKNSHLLDGKIRLLPAHRTPLSSTINIDDENDVDENSSDEVVVTGISHLNARQLKGSKRISSGSGPESSVIIDDDDDISEIIELDEDEEEKVKSKRKTANTNEVIDLDAKENEFTDLPYVEPVNTFHEFLRTPSLKDDWFQNFNLKWEKKGKARKEEVGKTVEIAESITTERLAFENDLRARLQDIYIVDPELLGVDDFEKPEAEEVPEFPELNQARIKAAVCGPPDQVLIEKFSQRITRRDIHTLLGLNWLNDEVINFYMNMITERSENKHETQGYPKVYAMNTFFLQRVLQSGHAGVKRWTRKVDIFDKDVIPVPVHVGGVHWCMAIIHLKNRWIRYYDSMGSPNPNVLKALEQYLKDESLDKRKQPFDTSGFVIESVADVPRQQNGSDCGVFSCMFAEYTARNKAITFEQKHMEYFRHKMILEIVQGELLL